MNLQIHAFQAVPEQITDLGSSPVAITFRVGVAAHPHGEHRSMQRDRVPMTPSENQSARVP
jgi:hypothetical protein